MLGCYDQACVGAQQHVTAESQSKLSFLYSASTQHHAFALLLLLLSSKCESASVLKLLCNCCMGAAVHEFIPWFQGALHAATPVQCVSRNPSRNFQGSRLHCIFGKFALSGVQAFSQQPLGHNSPFSCFANSPQPAPPSHQEGRLFSQTKRCDIIRSSIMHRPLSISICQFCARIALCRHM